MPNLPSKNQSTGRIIRGVGSFYDVRAGSRTVRCKARGAFRNEGVVPMVGDMVRFHEYESGFAQILEILPRKNALIRPTVANIDQLVMMLSASVPEPDWLLADKLIIAGSVLAIQPVLVLNKIDQADEQILDAFRRDYRLFPTFELSTVSGAGMDAFFASMEHAVSAFAGQSAVGKTSVLNCLFPHAPMLTGLLSQKTDRGRHTTRHVELLPFGDGAVLDTPGFSFLEQPELTQEQLDACYPEFGAAQGCRFASCAHISEPECGVKALLEAGKMTVARYDRYVTIRKEIQERRKHRYD